MNEPVDYFSNHALKLRFPWRLYHGPIIRELQTALARAPGREVLNLGSGPFFELPRLGRTDKRFTLCDIDPRALELARRTHGATLAGTDPLLPGASLPYPDSRFDAIVSMDVVEHVVDPVPWLREALRVLKPGGLLFLTTPNYASRSLRAIENSALEAIARAGRASVGATSTRASWTRTAWPTFWSALARPRLRIRSISFGWVLAAYVRR